MAAPIYNTPEDWKNLNIIADKDPVVRLLLEIYNQLKNNSMGIMQQFYTTTNGTADIQNDALTGNTVRNVFVDGVLLTPTTDWTFVSATGTITLVNIPDTGITVLIEYN